MKWGRFDGFVRIHRKRAERLYGEGKIIYLCPCRLRPGEPWHPEIAICLTDGDGAKVAPAAFDSAVSMFEFYNCSYATGKYASFYIVDDSYKAND